MSKTCSRCNETKPLEDYPRSAGYTHGNRGQCRSCLNEIARIYRRKNTERKREINRRWRESHREQDRERLRRWRSENELKQWAQNLVKRAVNQGRLRQRACLMCESVETVAHHPDYLRPLEVVWLCERHHKQVHASADIELSIDDLREERDRLKAENERLKRIIGNYAQHDPKCKPTGDDECRCGLVQALGQDGE